MAVDFEKDPSRSYETSTIVLLAVSLVYYLWAVQVGFDHRLTDHHAFRQTQTAISSYYMVRLPWHLAYETPVLGPPWAIPLEFPLFQWIVASLVRLTASPLDQTGRVVSIAFHLLTVAAAYLALGALAVHPAHRRLAVSLLLSSPFYIFWSRTFMIESCALFLATAYLAAALWTAVRPSRLTLVCAAVLGCLATLVKITTAVPFVMGVALAQLVGCVARPGPIWRTLQTGLPRSIALVALPVLAGLVWTSYADSVKLANVIGERLTSAQLHGWSLGTLSQRLDPDVWRRIFERADTLLGTRPAFVLAVPLFVVGVVTARTRRAAMMLSAALFVVSPLIFTNLHLVHDYYMFANGIFLLAGVGLGLVAMVEHERWRPAGVAIGTAFLISGIVGHQQAFLPVQRSNPDELMSLAEELRRTTSESEVNVFFGFDWNPTVPYYSERRALMIPDWEEWALTDERASQALQTLDRPVGAIIVKGSRRWEIGSVRELLATTPLHYGRLIVLE